MNGIAASLIARPHFTVPALALPLALVWPGFLSGAIVALLLMQKGVAYTAAMAGLAAVLLAGIGAIVGLAVPAVLANAASVWVPVAVLTAILMRSRSLVLTLQLAFVMTVAGLLLFHAVVDDPIAFWRGQLTAVLDAMRARGNYEQADLFASNEMLGNMTMVSVLVAFCITVVGTVLGYRLYRALPGNSAVCGRFRDFGYGRVLALATAVVSLAAWLGGYGPLQELAFVMFAMFWLQGLAIAHWSHGQGFLPTFGLVAMYVLAPLLNAVLMIGLAITGYLDAWFGFRRLRTV